MGQALFPDPDPDPKSGQISTLFATFPEIPFRSLAQFDTGVTLIGNSKTPVFEHFLALNWGFRTPPPDPGPYPDPDPDPKFIEIGHFFDPDRTPNL